MNKIILKNSEQWTSYIQNVLGYSFDICDPDSWNRNNWEYSWCEEEISLNEFGRRLMISSTYNLGEVISFINTLNLLGE